MYINLANIDFGGEGGGKAVLQETTIESLLTETTKVVTPPEGVDGFNKVTVTHAPVETLTEATITSNGDTTITPSAGYDATFGVKVSVDVPKSDYTIGGPEWFKDMTSKYERFVRFNYDHQEYMIIDNRKLTIGKCDDNSVPKLDSNGNQITDSGGNIVYEKIVPIYTRNTYSGFTGKIFTDVISNLPWNETLYLSTESTINIHWPDGNQYEVHPVFFPIATTPLDSSNEFIWGANNCIAMLNFNGTGTHNDPIQIVRTGRMRPTDLRSDQGSICNQNGIEFGGWMLLTKGCDPIRYTPDDHPILKNKNVTEINLIISSEYDEGYSGDSGIPNFVTNIKSIEMTGPLSKHSMSHMFADLQYLTNIPYFNTEGVTNMSQTFYNCRSLTNIPYFNTEGVTNMSQTFCNCRSLTSIPQLNTSKVELVTRMFEGCKSLTSIPKLDATSLTNAQNMFGYSYAPLDKFTTFGGLTNLKIDLDLSTCKNLTHDSLLNVINEAADVTASPKTLTLGDTNLAKLTDEEKAIATSKGWTLK